MMDVKNNNKITEIGEMPVHWNVIPLKDVLTVMYGKNQSTVEVDNSDIPILGTGGIIGWSKKPLFNKESVLIGRKGTIDKPIYINIPFWTIDTLFYTDINIEKANIKFIYYLFQSIDWYKYNEATGVPSLSAKNISNILFACPTLHEQQKIAEILSTIDEQIEQTDKLIEKTKELKKGLMQELLTKGIGHTAFQESELGEIPVEWTIKSLAEISNDLTIGLVTTMTTNYINIGVPLIRNSDIKEGFVRTEKMINLSYDFANSYKHKMLKKGDIVTVHTGDIGTSAVINDNLIGALGFAILQTTVQDNVSPEWLMSFFNSQIAKNQFYNFSTGDGRNNLNLKDFVKTRIIVPNSLNEQKQIAIIIASVDEDIKGYEKEKAKYEELKKGLMQQLLTGKTRVKVD